MRPEYITSSRPIEVRHGVVALSGYGINVAVEHSLLMLSDGVGRDRRFGAFHRVTAGIRRLIVLGHAGTISFEALRWLRDIGAACVHIDADGSVVTTSVINPPDDARLRRAQALATTNGAALPIARRLLNLKLTGQRDVLRGCFGRDGDFDSWLPQIDNSESLLALRTIEANAALDYWGHWKSVEIQFARRDAPIIPTHWKQFTGRTSELTGSPRRATSPTNALLNYLYALLEAETRIACLKVGLDPGIGLLHADQPSRDSLVLDILEAIRPEIDLWVLDQLRSRVFGRHDFHETREGVCRILPPLTHVLAETTPRWARLVAPVVESVAAQLAGSRSTPTRLSQVRRSQGRERYRRVATKQPSQFSPPSACLTCGTLLTSNRNRYCDDCIPENRNERLNRLQVAQQDALEHLRAEGKDPAHGGQAAAARGLSVATRHRENKKWDQQNTDLTMEDFNHIAQGFKNVSLRQIARATSLSLRYCSLVRKGLVAPHRRHWEKLASLVREKAP